MKTCSECGVEKPLTEFYTRKNRWARVPYARCKPCYAAYLERMGEKRGLGPVTVSEKRCARCGEVKPAEAFGRNRRAKTGLQSYCHVCMHQHRQARLYGLQPGELEAQQDAAGGRCPACTKARPLVIDHNHKTGLFRGLLCGSCNLILGHAGDDPATLRALADYLERPVGPEERLLRSRTTREHYPPVRPSVEPVPPPVKIVEHDDAKLDAR